jgi:hypothetical protein
MNTIRAMTSTGPIGQPMMDMMKKASHVMAQIVEQTTNKERTMSNVKISIPKKARHKTMASVITVLEINAA